MRHYHNTNGLEGAQLALALSRAITQEERVLEVFKDGVMLTPEGVLEHFPRGTPLTSVRRAISNLTKAGILRKTDRMDLGFYGAPVHYWTRA